MLLIIYKAVSRKLTTTKRTKTKNLEENHFKVCNVMEVEQLALPQSYYVLFQSTKGVLMFLGIFGKSFQNLGKLFKTITDTILCCKCTK